MIEMMINLILIFQVNIKPKEETIVDLIVMFLAKVEMIEMTNHPDTTAGIEGKKNKHTAQNPAQILLQISVAETKRGKAKRRREIEADQENIVDTNIKISIALNTSFFVKLTIHLTTIFDKCFNN